MKLSKFKSHYRLTLAELSIMLDRDEKTVRNWIKDDYAISSRGRTINCVIRPTKTVWESPEYKQRSIELGVNQ